MEVGDKLRELNMTADEVDKFTKAFKDEKFRGMLRDYAEEISDPKNRKKYEEEIKLLEQERGNNIEFIHPTPFRALNTSVNGKQKCFINICGNDKVGKPECTSGVSEDGRRGQRWSLPHSLHPGRQDTDSKGNTFMIYDVVFHPDTLHMAGKGKKFMDMVDKTAIQGIQNSFNVNLDEKNVRELKTKYKGTPQPCVIRKPIPAHKAREPSESHDPLSFPYPDEKRPTTSSQTKPAESKNSSDSNPKSFQLQFQKTNEPTKPNYTVKYRSVIDLQDFRCSRDSTKSPRPKEIVVTIDLPLVKSVTDASLEAKQRTLLLETTKPAYRLELPLAYPVDEDKGEAKFNKHTGQLTVTLPVLPSDVKAFDFPTGPVETVSDVQSVNDERQENNGESEVNVWDGKEMEGSNSEEGEAQAEDLLHHTMVQNDDEKERGQEKGMRQMRNGQETVEGNGHVVGENENFREQSEKWQESVERGAGVQKSDRIYESGQEEEKLKQQQDDGQHAEKCKLQIKQDNNCGKRFSKDYLSGDGCDRAAEIKEQKTTGCLGEEGKDIRRETENTEQTKESTLKGEEDAAFENHIFSEEYQTTADGSCIFQGTEEFDRVPATGGANASQAGSSSNQIALFSEKTTTTSAQQEEREDIDEDDLPREHKDKPPTVVLREIDEDGNEKIICDHSVSSGMIFQNTLMYQLD